jgi:hypothetical protein
MSEGWQIVVLLVLLVGGLVGSHFQGREAFFHERVEKLKARQKRRLLRRKA